MGVYVSRGNSRKVAADHRLTLRVHTSHMLTSSHHVTTPRVLWITTRVPAACPELEQQQWAVRRPMYPTDGVVYLTATLVSPCGASEAQPAWLESARNARGGNAKGALRCNNPAHGED